MWKRIVIYENLLYVFLAICFIILIIDKFILINIIPQKIIECFFWLSLGMMLGFRLCQYTTSKILNKNS